MSIYTPLSRIFRPAAVSAAILLILSGASGADGLTLQESISMALENNPAVRIARENISKADSMVKEAFSVGLPHLSIEGNYTRLDKVPTAEFGDQIIDIGSADSRKADLVLNQFVDVFGLVKTGKKAAEMGKSTYRYGLEKQMNDTVLDTKTAFFNVLRAQEFLRVQEHTMRQLEAHLKEVKTFYAAGTVAQFDVLRAETQVANARQGLISAQNGVSLAKSAFNSVLNRPLETPVELVDPGKPEFADLQLKTCTDSACDARPEVLMAGSQIGLNEQMVKVAKLGGKPKVNLRWGMNHNFDISAFNPRESSWTAVLLGSLNLFDGGATKAAVGKATSDLKNSESAKEQAVVGVTLDAQQSFLSTKEGEERIKAAETALEQAREANRLAEVRYKAGVSTQLEVLDAQTALTLAETNYVNAVYDYQIALAKLEKAVGGPVRMASLLDESKQKVAADR